MHHKSGANNEYFLELVVHGYLFSRREIIDTVAQGERPDIEDLIEAAINSRNKQDDEYHVFKSVDFEWSIEQLWNSLSQPITSSSDPNSTCLYESVIYNLYTRPTKNYRLQLASQNIEMISEIPEFKLLGDYPIHKCPRYFELFMDR